MTSTAGKGPDTRKYEYKTVTLSPPSPERLNELGADGWELVQVVNGNQYVFKRPVPQGFLPSEFKGAGEIYQQGPKEDDETPDN